ncbi:hypothetical protein CGCA056_v010157 [Colletotrichum aenigma]|uniref:uncharacterized protein n=1 Tax=Colletotrichum aenigma TaxID=1215731 RepID=UPI0018730D79|nr:uncharacterized protein CGCA056_v010157 [Colletotrichum aenigma]KAF5519427.1 hypothetical protein CGCA056_v010157 [Colletotrichum aenigma]
MATAVPDILPNPDVDHWGIGVLFEEDGPDCRRCGSRSPGRSSISLETKEAVVASPRPEIKAKSSPFRRSGAPSPESRSIRSITDDIAGLQKQVGDVEQEDAAMPRTPLADPSSDISTSPTCAGPMSSYLTRPEAHEKRALSLRVDDDAEDVSDCEGSVLIGLKTLPGVHRARKRSHSPIFGIPRPKSPGMPHALERYLASTASDEGQPVEDPTEVVRPISQKGLVDRLGQPGIEGDSSEPLQTVPATGNEPREVERDPAEPAIVEPAAVGPAAVEPAVIEPAVIEPAVIEPAVIEPAPVDPVPNSPALAPALSGEQAIANPPEEQWDPFADRWDRPISVDADQGPGGDSGVEDMEASEIYARLLVPSPWQRLIPC